MQNGIDRGPEGGCSTEANDSAPLSGTSALPRAPGATLVNYVVNWTSQQYRGHARSCLSNCECHICAVKRMLRRNLRVGFKPTGFYIVCASVLHTCVSELHTCLHTRVSTQHSIFRQMRKTGDRRNITRAVSTRNMPFYYSKNMPFTTAIVLWILVHSQQHLAAQQERTASLCAWSSQQAC